MQQHAMIPPVALGTNGHLPAIVAQAPERAEQQAAESADRYIAREYPHVAALLAEPAGLLTEAQRTLRYDTGLGAHLTAPVETSFRDIDGNATPAENAETPWLTAQVCKMPNDSHWNGETRVWLTYGTTVGELSPAEAREALAAMRQFTAQLEAVCDRADEIAADGSEAQA